ncbi:recombinase family protein [Kushneria indalinina]|uniref:DNA invertase Pin-like site-specific DNA recombinase n=1 Tax=Kushneria indalinina DSM 14324 TaxID=1122140 RepID=A0A3D9DSD0_9GAMM|nr:recombinase family protein [Kushneria indalinina]REC93309.1 DNA invertase Pin-like site-specific DNA recombinase [Kushneria indalinina DSM 14324]
MRIGYARVSREDQRIERQIDALEKAGCERIFQERISGARKDRPELEKLLMTIRPDDTVVVLSLDRLGRSLIHLVELVNQLQGEGVQIESIQDNIDQHTATGRLHINFLAVMADWQRAWISEKTREGLESARARGRVGGRPKGLSKDDIHSMGILLSDPSMKVSDVAKRFGISRTTLYRYFPGGVKPKSPNETQSKGEGEA